MSGKRRDPIAEIIDREVAPDMSAAGYEVAKEKFGALISEGPKVR